MNHHCANIFTDTIGSTAEQKESVTILKNDNSSNDTVSNDNNSNDNDSYNNTSNDNTSDNDVSNDVNSDDSNENKVIDHSDEDVSENNDQTTLEDLLAEKIFSHDIANKRERTKNNSTFILTLPVNVDTEKKEELIKPITRISSSNSMTSFNSIGGLLSNIFSTGASVA